MMVALVFVGIMFAVLAICAWMQANQDRKILDMTWWDYLSTGEWNRL